MNILLTGGAGFIGSAVARHLLARGDSVVVVDNFEPTLYPRAVKEAALTETRQVAAQADAGTLVFHEVDIRDRAALEQLAASDGPFDALVHLAAVAGVRPSVANPALYYDINVTGTQHVVDVARVHGAGERLILASSSSVYGGNTSTPFSERDDVSHPVSPYAASKLALEHLARADQHLHGGTVACLRFFTVYGPGQRPEMAIHKFMRLIADGETVPMFGDGSSGRDYTYIDDIVDGLIACLDRAPQLPGFNVFNLGGDRVMRLAPLIAAIGEVVGRTPIIASLPMEPGDVPLTMADVSHAEALLGYRPKVGLEQGLAQMWAWYQR